MSEPQTPLIPAPGRKPGEVAVGMATPAPSPPMPVPALVPNAFQAGVFVSPLKRLSVPAQDLSGDKLLLAAPRVAFEGRSVPALGGIPLLAKIGQGGMGAVYYGIHPRLYLEVAVKILPFHLAEETPELVSRFLREARIAAQVKSPHLVGVLDVDENQGLHYLVMEYVQGISAAGYLRNLRAAGHAGMPEPIALDICLAAAEGLRAAHAKGIVHRDVKPENILVPRSDDGRWLFSDSKLADLGLARGESQGQSLTGTQAHMGTPGYMAPEQARDAKTAEAPSDVFGLGASLYALLAGQAPFIGSSAFQVLTDTVQKPHRPLPELRLDVSPALAMIVDRCLQKDPAQRYPNGSALAEALRSVRAALVDPGPALTPGEEPTLRFAPPPPPVPFAAAASTVAPATTPQPRPPAASHAGRYIAAVAIIAILALGGFFLWSRTGLESGSGSRKDHPPVVAVKTTEPAKPVSPPSQPGESDQAFAAAKEEAARRQLLEDRQKTFSACLTEADGLLEKDPAAALVKLDAAGALGASDAVRGLPDLLASLKPSLEVRCEEAKARLRHRQEEAAWKEQEAAALATFTQEWNAGRQAAELQDWKGAEERIAAALKGLGELAHPDQAAAEALLQEVVAVRKRREDFAAQIKSGERALTEGDCVAAEKAFDAAVKLAPDVAGTNEAEKGLQSSCEVRLKQRYQTEMDAGRAAAERKAWTEAERSFGRALELRPGDEAADKGIKACRAGARDESFRQALAEAEASRAQQKWAEALVACQRALEVKPGDAVATQLAAGIRYGAAMSEGRERLTAADRLGAEAAFLRALREQPGDAAATKSLALARERPAPSPPPPLVTNVEPAKPAPPAPPAETAFGPPIVIGTFAVYANRPSQGIPLDKNGRLIRIGTNLDKELYEEATKTLKSFLQVEKGTKVRIEATGTWFSGPGGSWVGPNGMREDGTNTLKRFRAFEGPENAYGIAKLIVFISEKNSVKTAEFSEIEKKGWRWGCEGPPLEFVMPETGTLRFQQNRDGFYDVTQGAVEVTITLFKPAK